ncbi:MAG: GNAT family N-acetyltransferase [Gammaproteobacteria bacterium]|nr:GNAT family N-acetyltransferase [Gammaproteobacteria bacterium]
MRGIYIPSSTTVLSRYNGEIVGFISLVENTFASIFILPDYQGKAIGQKLLTYAFKEKEAVVLNVYEKTISARNFYLRNGFTEQKRSVDEHTGEIEITMARNGT